MRFEEIKVGQTVYWFGQTTVHSGKVVVKREQRVSAAEVVVETTSGYILFTALEMLYPNARDACLTAARKLLRESADAQKAAAALLERAGISGIVEPPAIAAEPAAV